MFLSNLSVNRAVLTTMMVMVLVVLGLFSYTRLSIDLYPEVNFPFVTVTTIYPGAGPKEVESQVTEKIESEVIAISNVRRVQSYSQENVSFVLIEFELGVNPDLAAIDVKDKVDAIRFELPDDSEPPSVSKFDIQAIPIMDIAISGSRGLEELYEIADNHVKDPLSRVNGVASVTITGGKEREIQVLVSREKLQGYGLAITDIVRTISMANLSIPAGRISQSRREYAVRLVGEFVSLEELANLEVPLYTGGRVKLTDIAEVKDGFKEQRELARYNDQPSVSLSIQKRSDANAVATAQEIDKEIAKLKLQLPDDVNIDVAQDSSVFIREAVRDVQVNIAVGILLTALVLYLFLHNFRATLIVALAMPTSIIATLLLIDAAGFTLNVMSLMALGISVGILVANAIVVLENISRHMELGESRRAAAKIGTKEIAVAVLASTMTNLMVFTPIGFMSGIVGQFFRQFGLTVVFATAFSLLVSFTLTPMLASRLLRSSSESRRGSPLRGFFELWERGYTALEQWYRGSLGWTLRHRILTSLFTMLAFIGGFALFRFIGFEFMPNFDQGLVSINVEMPPGTSLEVMDDTLKQIEKIASESPESEAILTKLGGSGTDQGVQYGLVTVSLAEERDRTTNEVLEEMRGKLLPAIPDALFTFSTSESGPRSGSDIEIEVSGIEMDALEEVAAKVQGIVTQVPGLVDVKSTMKSGKPELAVQLERRKLERHGLSVAQVGMLLRTSLTGEVASVYREGNEEYDIRVQLSEDARRVIESADRILINAPGHAIPLSELGEVSVSEGPTQIIRMDKQRTVLVTANIAQGVLGEKLSAIRAETDQLELPEGYGIRFGGTAETMKESFASLLTALVMAIILTYMLLAAILESFVHPFTIMITLPLGLIGAALALFLTGITINIFSMMALIMLIGIVVNNAILMLDYTIQLRKEGLGIQEALLEACPTRLRPVIMTNIAITAGMLPQALGTAGAAAIRASMAIVTIGGVLISTLLTVFVLPMVYTAFDRIAKPPQAEAESEA